MTDERPAPLDDLVLDHVVFHVGDAEAVAAELVHGYGLDVVARSGTAADLAVALGKRDISLVLRESAADSPVAAYVHAHGDGVADIALRTADARAAFDEAVRRGARPVSPPEETGGVVTAAIGAFGDVTHTFVQRAGGLPPGFAVADRRTSGVDTGVRELDHFAVCLEGGQLEPTVRYYEEVLGFRMIFEEKIVVGRQAMNSQVVQSVSGKVTLTLLEPDATRESGQIDEFLKNHGGAGVQHIAFTTDEIVASVGAMAERGVGFLRTPGSYYELLADRITLDRHSITELRALDVLVDEDHQGQLFQIFARSTHPRKTFFFEVIERAGARTFGSGNIKALYEAVEVERLKAEGS